MTVLLAAALLLWLLLTAASVLPWLPTPPSRHAPLFARTSVLVSTIIIAVVVVSLVALLGHRGGGATGVWSWVIVGLAVVSAVLTGGAVTTSILSLADSASRPHSPRVKENVLRGGTWIGALERVGIAASLLAGWPEGIAVILAVKGLARYPELKTFHSTGAAERFIIGTFASIGWAATCAGVAVVLQRG